VFGSICSTECAGPTGAIPAGDWTDTYLFQVVLVAAPAGGVHSLGLYRIDSVGSAVSVRLNARGRLGRYLREIGPTTYLFQVVGWRC